MHYRRLFSSLRINTLELENRLVMPALHHGYTPGGHASERFNRYYWRRAEGGAGLIIVGGCMIDSYHGYPDIMSLENATFVPGWRNFVKGMHERGAKVCVQLMQTGRYGKSKYVYGDDAALAPSAVYSAYTQETPRAMTPDEIHNVIRCFAEASARAVEAGFDMIELSGSAGYLISQFLSPVTNLRTDEYGGDFAHRARFALEVVAAVRQAVGKGYPLAMRVAGNDFIRGGHGSGDCVAFCRLLEQAGIDMIDVTGGWHETSVPQLPGEVPRAAFTYLAQAVKDAVSVPVMASNRMNDPAVGERVLALEQADLIGVGRPLIADPDWPLKAQTGRADEIRRCVACNQGCLGRMFFDEPIECLVNGYAGREYLFVDSAPKASSKILVVGAGPAGCEFAIRAAERGHQVTIWEKSSRIGGQLSVVAVPPGKREFENLTAYFRAMMDKTGVAVEVNKEATAEAIRQAGFDEIVLAAGSVPVRICLPGSDIVPVCTAEDILTGREVAGRNVVVVGGGSVGCETAEYLAQDGSLTRDQLYFMMAYKAESPEAIASMLKTSRRKIAIVDMARIGRGFDHGCGWPVMQELRRLGVRLHPSSSIVEVTHGSVVIETRHKSDGEISRRELACDTIVLAVGSRPNTALLDELTEFGLRVHTIGDAVAVDKVLTAIRQADDLAMQF